MARTEAGRILTEQHRQAQIEIRTQALRDFLRLWPIWQGDEESFNEMAAAAIVLVRAYRQMSAAVAGGYFEQFRRAEGVPDEAATRLAGPVNPFDVTAALSVTARDAVSQSLRAGRDPDDARKAALVRSSGAVTREVLNGGRETLLQSVAEDRQALGWARVTDGDPCAFCALLAGRGPVYKSQESASFQSHGHCTCGVMPFYDGADWPGKAREFHALYNRAIGEAREAGELRRGTSNDLLNAFRRFYDAERS